MAKKNERKGKLIYDPSEKDREKACYLEYDDGEKHYYPFWHIKVSNGMWTEDLKKWPKAKEMREYSKKMQAAS